MRHRGVHVGNFYLVEKEDGKAFTDQDEEILVLFASQAATAIANARAYRAETVRAEEIVLTTPDGRSVTTLVNATPIDAEDGTLASVVVTLPSGPTMFSCTVMAGSNSHVRNTRAGSIPGAARAARTESRSAFQISCVSSAWFIRTNSTTSHS